MRPVRAKITIDRPIAEVYEYLVDIGSRPEFAPELFRDFRLSRVESRGQGAGARFRLHRKIRDRFAGTTIVTATPGQLILEEGSTGRAGRVPLAIEYALEQLPGDVTSVHAAFQTHPLNPVDQLREWGMRRHVKRLLPRALRRLRDILEETPSTRRGERASVGGMDPRYVPNP
ncbi:MAG: SRPBCC family protein [Solirubrobacterales bacterium]